MSRGRIIPCAVGFGPNPARNAAIQRLAQAGRVTEVTIIVPGVRPGPLEDAVRALPDVGIGIALCLSGKGIRPLLGDVPSLTGADGCFYPLADALERHANEGDALREITAQLDALSGCGISISHAGVHHQSLYGWHTGRDLMAPLFQALGKAGIPLAYPARRLQPDYADMNGALVRAQVTRAMALAGQYSVRLADYVHSDAPEDAAISTDHAAYAAMMAKRMACWPDGAHYIALHPEVPGLSQGAGGFAWGAAILDMLESGAFARAAADAGFELTRF
nr:ChbG/HpnK family deacetylase [bacterium]